MNNNSSDNRTDGQETKTKFNILDFFIIFVVVLCIAGVLIRYYIGDQGELPGKKIELENYVISFMVQDIRQSSTEQFVDGDEFYLASNSKLFGTLTGNVTVTPAERYLADNKGNLILSYAPDNGEASRIDLRGTILVEGNYDEESKGFMLNGNTYIAPNRSLYIQSKNIAVNITITDIVKAS